MGLDVLVWVGFWVWGGLGVVVLLLFGLGFVIGYGLHLGCFWWFYGWCRVLWCVCLGVILSLGCCILLV